MLRDCFLVGLGSFFGGSLRFLVSKWVQAVFGGLFPLGTWAVNVVGCFLIGFLAGLPWGGRLLSPQIKLLLTTGFCGGFTTFSTFMSESGSLLRDGNYLHAGGYVVLSLLVGFVGLVLGHQLSKVVA